MWHYSKTNNDMNKKFHMQTKLIYMDCLEEELYRYLIVLPLHITFVYFNWTWTSNIN